MPTTPIRIQESPQGRFDVIKGGRKAQFEFLSFLLQINDHLPRGIDKATKELAFLLPYFEACVEEKFSLADPSVSYLQRMGILLELAFIPKLIEVRKVELVPLEDFEPRPAWMSPIALKQDFFKLLHQSLNETFLFPGVLREHCRPEHWKDERMIPIELTLQRTIGAKLKACVESTFRNLGQKHFWSHYTSKVLADVPSAIVIECLLAYCIEDQKRLNELQPLAEVSSEVFILGRQRRDSYTWLALVGQKTGA